jgi:beta-glucosidase
VLFPFGHGLTYTQFTYSNLRLARKSIAAGEGVDLSLTVQNTGSFDAAEVVQLYVEPPKEEAFRPLRELKGFTKVFLKAGEKKRVTLTLEPRAFACWHTGLGDWYCAPGDYTVVAAASSRDLRLSAVLKLNNTQAAESPYAGLALPSYTAGQAQQVSTAEFEALLGFALPPADLPVPRRLTLDSTIEDAQQSPAGRLLRLLIDHALPLAQLIMGDSIGDLTNTVASTVEMPVHTIAQWSGGFVDAEMADAIVSIFNQEHYLQSLFALAKGGVRAVKKLVFPK